MDRKGTEKNVQPMCTPQRCKVTRCNSMSKTVSKTWYRVSDSPVTGPFSLGRKGFRRRHQGPTDRRVRPNISATTMPRSSTVAMHQKLSSGFGHSAPAIIAGDGNRIISRKNCETTSNRYHAQIKFRPSQKFQAGEKKFSSPTR